MTLKTRLGGSDLVRVCLRLKRTKLLRLGLGRVGSRLKLRSAKWLEAAKFSALVFAPPVSSGPRA